MKINVNTPTYSYRVPIKFCGAEYHDSKSFVEAILDSWDDAITEYMCGNWADLWAEHTDLDEAKCSEIQSLFNEPYEEIWQNSGKKNVDVMFTKALYYLEPSLREIPCFISNQDQLELWYWMKYKFYISDWGRKGGIIRELLSEDMVVDPEQSFDEAREGARYACHMIREKVFETYGCSDVEFPLKYDISWC